MNSMKPIFRKFCLLLVAVTFFNVVGSFAYGHSDSGSSVALTISSIQDHPSQEAHHCSQEEALPHDCHLGHCSFISPASLSLIRPDFEFHRNFLPRISRNSPHLLGLRRPPKA